MPHMVIYRNAEGKPAYHQTDALEDAVRFVERLRNEQHINDSRLFRMEEVPIEFKTYYRVEVAVGEPAGMEAPTAEQVAEVPADVPVEVPVEAPVAEVVAEVPVLEEAPLLGDLPEPQPVAVGNGAGRFGLFGKS